MTPATFFKHFDTLADAPNAVAKLREMILQMAVMGKLVPQDPAAEPASDLLHRVALAKGQMLGSGTIKKQRPHQVVSQSDVPFQLANGWSWCRFGDVVSDLRYGTSRKCEYEIEGTPVLRIPNLKNGAIDIKDLKFTTMPESELRDLSLSRDDMLIIRSNGSTSLVGRGAVVGQIAEGYAYAGYLIRVRMCPTHVYPRYLQLALETRATRNQIELPIRTTSGVKNVNSGEISNILIPLPPTEEQHRIVAKVDHLMTLCDGLEAKLRQSQADSQRLLAAAVNHLLNGGPGA